MRVEILSLSSPGGRDYNEDCLGQWSNERYCLCLIADGAGGHGGGDVAAAIVRSSILSGFAANPSLQKSTLLELLEKANLDVVARQSEGGHLSSMRTTLVMVALDLVEKEYVFAHVGDSRAYLYRNGQMLQRTIDHSMVQKMINKGLLDDESARVHPMRNILLSALGSIDDPMQVGISECAPLCVDDRFLLCSDGVWELLGDKLLLEAATSSKNPAHWLGLIDVKVHQWAKPNHDNYTAMVLWLRA